jgi:hypothetical protein
MTTEPPTTPPTTEHHDPEYQPEDLLADDGTVDISAIKSITNTDNTPGERVSPSECRRFRQAVADGTQPRNVETDFARRTVRRHAHGECHHDHNVPAVEYDDEREQWVCNE